MALDGFLVSEFTVSLYNESQLSFHFDSGVKYNQQCLTVSYRKKTDLNCVSGTLKETRNMEPKGSINFGYCKIVMAG